jgi:hypothetical protein
MIGNSLTKENLQVIFDAMAKVKPVDRSDYFNNYYQEVASRLYEYSTQPVTSEIEQDKEEETVIDQDQSINQEKVKKSAD